MDLSDVGDQLETYIPQRYAESWDNVGWMVGPLSEQLEGVLMTVDVTEEALRTATDRNLNLVLSHHPLIFESLDQIVEGRPVDDLISLALRERIGIYSVHTNADSMPGGLNDLFADVLSLEETQPIKPMEVDPEAGLGRVGHITEPISMDEVENKLREELDLTHVKSLGDSTCSVQTIGVCTGSGGDFISGELAQQVDLFITGDVDHHQALEAQALDLPVIILDHYEMETVFLPFAESLWQEQFGDQYVYETFRRRNPYRHKTST